MGYVLVTAGVLVKSARGVNKGTRGQGTGTGTRERWFRSMWDGWSAEVFNGLLSFVLSWTLSFALVHGTPQTHAHAPFVILCCFGERVNFSV